ncbi:MAG: thrombospondin type-1 domain-containing protein, partial [Myxococcota bacterium]
DCRSGVCTASTCQLPADDDGLQNGQETDTDCGGPSAPPCSATRTCVVPSDCASDNCDGAICQAVSAGDGVQNGDETDVDCGGSAAPPCPLERSCVGNPDCSSGACVEGVCVDAACTDGQRNGLETAVDCGGGSCPRCSGDLACLSDTDCISESCVMGTGLCAPPTYSWVQSGFGACSVTCGDGVQTQSVECQRNDGLVVDDSLCAEPKPSTEVGCEATAGCVWSASGFGACSVGCGVGSETRSVECLSPELGSVDESLCDAGSRPADSQACERSDGCQWVLGAFGACSDVCAGGVSGTRSRSRSCTDTVSAASVAIQLCVDALGDETATEGCQGTGTPGDDWTNPSFGSCSVTCGDGVRSRTEPTCTNPCGCSTPMPPTTQACSDSTDCLYRDQESDWGACSVDCQLDSGTQTRPLVCINPGGGEVAGSFCNGKPEPATSRACNGSIPPGNWQVGPWPSCAGLCFESVFRTVTCNPNMGCGCNPANEPPNNQLCLDCDCPPGELCLPD